MGREGYKNVLQQGTASANRVKSEQSEVAGAPSVMGTCLENKPGNRQFSSCKPCKALVSCSVMSDFVILWSEALQVPLSMEFFRQEHQSGALLQGIFLTQGWNPGLLHCRQSISCLSQRTLYSTLNRHQHSPRPTATATAKSLQSCPTLCNPIDSSPPGSPVAGILQARTLEWVAISFSNV